jgi:hypothetical protein
MRLTDLIVQLRTVMLPRLPAGADVLQGWQPTTQGAPDAPAITLYVTSDVDFGSPSRADVWDEPNAIFVHREVQQRETTFQVNAIVPAVNPADLTALTAQDLLRQFRMHLRSDAVLAALRVAGLSILRPRDIRQVWVESDGGQPESNPSFDLVVRHSDILESTTPVVITSAVIIERV